MTARDTTTAAQLDASLTDRLHEFLGRYYDPSDPPNPLAELALDWPTEQRSLSVSYDDLYRWNPDVADDLLRDPEYVLAHLREAVRTYDLPATAADTGQVEFDPDVRIADLDTVPEASTRPVGGVSARETGTLRVLEGQVSQVAQSNIYTEEIEFECARCGNRITVPQPDPEYRQDPHECAACDRQGPWRIVDSEDVDHQLVRLQRPPEQSAAGADPDTIDVWAYGDLVDDVVPGDRVRLAARLEKQYDDETPTAEITATANAIEPMEIDYTDIDYEEYREEIETIAAGDPIQQIVDSIKPSHTLWRWSHGPRSRSAISR